MTIGALAYLLNDQGVEDSTIRRLLSQTSIDVIRHFALDLPWRGRATATRFSLADSDVLERLQHSCENQQSRNHVIKIVFRENNTIHVEGMLYSQYAWVLNLSNRISVEEPELRLKTQSPI